MKEIRIHRKDKRAVEAIKKLILSLSVPIRTQG